MEADDEQATATATEGHGAEGEPRELGTENPQLHAEDIPELLSGHESGTALSALKDGWAVFPSVLERYYTAHCTSNHQTLHVHSNGLCLLGISPDHPKLQPPLKVTSVAFRDHDSKNLLTNDVHGKKKAGAVFLLPRDMICQVTVSDGSTFVVYACVRGSVIEINRRLLDNPELLGSPSGAGYLLVLAPKLDEKRTIGQACLDFDRETPLTEPSGNAKRKAEGKRVRTSSKRQRERKPCWAFQRGNCHYGDQCRFEHGMASPAAASDDPPASDACDAIKASDAACPAPSDRASTKPGNGDRATDETPVVAAEA